MVSLPAEPPVSGIRNAPLICLKATWTPPLPLGPSSIVRLVLAPWTNTLMIEVDALLTVVVICSNPKVPVTIADTAPT